MRAIVVVSKILALSFHILKRHSSYMNFEKRAFVDIFRRKFAALSAFKTVSKPIRTMALVLPLVVRGFILQLSVCLRDPGTSAVVNPSYSTTSSGF